MSATDYRDLLGAMADMFGSYVDVRHEVPAGDELAPVMSAFGLLVRTDVERRDSDAFEFGDGVLHLRPEQVTSWAWEPFGDEEGPFDFPRLRIDRRDGSRVLVEPLSAPACD